LDACIKARRNIVIAGPPRSGRTTLLNALAGMAPGNERIVTVEELAELRLPSPNVTAFEERPISHSEEAAPVKQGALIQAALMMRPDRLVVGDLDVDGVLPLFRAMAAGLEGVLVCASGSSPRDALGSLETLCMTSGVQLPVRAAREQVARAVHVVVVCGNMAGKRRVTHIVEVDGLDVDLVALHDVFTFEPDPGRGVAYGSFVASGHIPKFVEEVERRADIDIEIDMVRSQLRDRE